MNDTPVNNDTIAAIATPLGRGGIGVIRLSGPDSLRIGQAMIRAATLTPREAHYSPFTLADGEALDTGIAIYFQAPHSFTGEDVVELQGHGGPIVQDLLLKEMIHLGARHARPGEFTERAFLNNKMDLAQAEAIADLINSTTEQAARGAVRSLQGEFSNRIQALLRSLIELRMYVEAAIDFPEEEIDFLADESLNTRIDALKTDLQHTINEAGQGAILKNGIRVVLAGQPNVGKSSLLNALSGYDTAIVTDTPGTTRDIVSEVINIDGLPIHIIDTAGLRKSDDRVESIGIQRAKEAIESADHVLLLVDSNIADKTEEDTPQIRFRQLFADMFSDEWALPDVTLVRNKIDSSGEPAGKHGDTLALSAKTGQGLPNLRDHLKAIAGFEDGTENSFTARRRHVDALKTAQQYVQNGLQQLNDHRAGELLAEDLLQAQYALNTITGEFNADDLLGEIFSGFCIGK